MSYGGTPAARRSGKMRGHSAEVVVLDEPNEQLNPPMGSGPTREEARVEAAVIAAMDRAARAGLGQRGRIRAGERALAKERRKIEKERGR